MLTLGIDYLTGYATATSVASRNLAEWPPHPGRIFMAMAAAYFETRPDPVESAAFEKWRLEGEALRWLEDLGPPGIYAEEADRRSVVDVYVPPNDFTIYRKNGEPVAIPNPLQAGLKTSQKDQRIKGLRKQLEIFPSLRNKKERTFPKVWPRKNEVYLHWPDVELIDEIREALERVCEKVIRIGHSSSFVQMWLTEEKPPLALNCIPVQDEVRFEGKVEYYRVAVKGSLDYLRKQYNEEAINDFYEMEERVEHASKEGKKALQVAFEEKFGNQWNKRLVPISRRPVFSMTHGYYRTEKSSEAGIPSVSTLFDEALFILDKREGPVLGLESTWRLLTALRGAIETRLEPTPEWISGHEPDGRPSEKPHLALLPLGFVGNEHADGHLLGLALAFPRSVPLEERGRFVGKLLYNASGQPEKLRLTLGKHGVWVLCEEERASPPLALRSATWTGPAKTWASVSPVVLDRHPKAGLRKDRKRYLFEVAAIVSRSCQHIGLPPPVEIDIDETSWHRGAPRSSPGRDGYPLMPRRPDGSNRRQVHVWLRFDQPVLGPVLLGAGRYRGYGFCKPWRKGEVE